MQNQSLPTEAASQLEKQLQGQYKWQRHAHDAVHHNAQQSQDQEAARLKKLRQEEKKHQEQEAKRLKKQSQEEKQHQDLEAAQQELKILEHKRIQQIVAHLQKLRQEDDAEHIRKVEKAGRRRDNCCQRQGAAQTEKLRQDDDATRTRNVCQDEGAAQMGGQRQDADYMDQDVSYTCIHILTHAKITTLCARHVPFHCIGSKFF